MKCKNCGTEFEGKFCYECGTQACPAQEESISQTLNQPFVQNTERQQMPEQDSWKQYVDYSETNKKKKIKKPIYKRKWFIFLIIIILIFIASKVNKVYKENKSYVNFDWSNIVLSDIIPEVPKGKAKISSNSEKGLYLEMKISENEYRDYVNACKKMGYIIDPDSDSTSYEAYNEEGYKLYISYYDGIFEIDLDEPMKISKINWSKIKL